MVQQAVEKPNWLERYRVSKKILGQSFGLIMSMRSYWVFPFIALLFIFLILGLGLAVGVGVVSDGAAASSSDGPTFLSLVTHPLFWIMAALLFPGIIVVTMTNCALAYGFYRRLIGRPVGVRVAWRKALSQIGPIVRYSLIAATVGLVLGLIGQVLEKFRFIPWLGQVFQIVGAFGWAAATFFVIPVIMVEREMRATRALRKSVHIARDNWGKSVSGIVTISLAVMVPVFLVVFPLLLVFPMVMAFVVPIEYMLVAMLGFMGLVFFLAAAAGMVSTTSQIAYQTGLYLYATTGRVQAPYTEETLVDAWGPYQRA